MTITIDRMNTNYGTREGSVRWHFEDFAFDETLFGSVMIRFTTNMEDDGRVNGDLKIVDFEVEWLIVNECVSSVFNRRCSMRLILPVHMLEDGDICFKKTGTTPLTVRKKIRIFGEGDAKSSEIVAEDGTRFLIAESGSVTCVVESKEVAIDIQTERELVRVATMLLHKNEIRNSR